MRVLHVIPAVAARYGGPSGAIVPMCRALSALGTESIVATTDADGAGRLPVQIGQPTSWQGIPAVFFKRAFSESFKYSPGLASWLSTHVDGFDVVHIHALLSHACFAAASACRRHDVPYVVRPLGTLVPWSLRQKAVRKRVLLAVGGMRILRGAAAIHYTSSQERKAVETALRLSRGAVVPLGIDVGTTDASPTSSMERRAEPYVLALSRLHPKKNLERLIEAFVSARQTVGDVSWRLVIAGAGDRAYVESLHRLVHERHADDCVRFSGWVEGETKAELIRRASMFALCSKHENFGLAVLEAAAAGVPPLLTREVDLADDVERATAGWVIDDVGEGLDATLADAMADPAEREARGRAALHLARRFTWPSVAAQLMRMYERIQHPSVLDSPANAKSESLIPNP